MDEHIYDVALWRYWPGDLVPYTDVVKGPSPLSLFCQIRIQETSWKVID